MIKNDVSWYATCSTAENISAKVATTSDSKFALVAGAKVSVKFDYANTGSNPTLNVDSTGAKNIIAGSSNVPLYWWYAGEIVEFIYSGSSWFMLTSYYQMRNSYFARRAVISLTVQANSFREYTITDFDSTDGDPLIQIPIVTQNGAGVTVGRNITTDFMVIAWNNTNQTKDVGIAYYVLFLTNQ